MRRIENGSKDDANKEGFTKKLASVHVTWWLLWCPISFPPLLPNFPFSFHFTLNLFSLSSFFRCFHSFSLFLAHIIFTSHKILFCQNFDAIMKVCLVSLGTLTVPSREAKKPEKGGGEESSDPKVLIGCHMSHSLFFSRKFSSSSNFLSLDYLVFSSPLVFPI